MTEVDEKDQTSISAEDDALIQSIMNQSLSLEDDEDDVDSDSTKRSKIRWADQVDVMFDDGRKDKEPFNDQRKDEDDMESLYETAADLIDMLLHPQVKQKKSYFEETKMARLTDIDDEEDVQKFQITAEFIDKQIEELTNEVASHRQPAEAISNPFTVLLQSKDEEIQKLKIELSNWQYNCKELERLGSTAVQELSVQLTQTQTEVSRLQQTVTQLQEENNDLKQRLSATKSEQSNDVIVGELKNKIKMLEQMNAQLLQTKSSQNHQNVAPNLPKESVSPVMDLPKSPSSVPELMSWVEAAKAKQTKITLPLEEYLSDTDFLQLFHTKRYGNVWQGSDASRTDFLAMPKWWQQLKRKKIFHL